MLGPSFSPNIARIPGPTSNHSKCQRRRFWRALWTLKRSRDLSRSSWVSPAGRLVACPSTVAPSNAGSGMPVGRAGVTG